MSNARIRVFIADDHPIVRRGLRELLKSDPRLICVGEATTGRGLASAVATVKTRVLMLDLSMPDFTDPAGFVKELAIEQPDVKVLVLTSYDNKEWILDLLQAGASGYLLKDEIEDGLIWALHRVAQGQNYYSQNVSQLMLHQFIEPTPPKPKRCNELTKREIEVLRLIGRRLSNQEIAEQLHISPFTVRSHITNINSKLDLDSRLKTIEYAIEHGYIDD